MVRRQETRPVLDIPWTHTDKVVNTLGLLFLVAQVVMLLAVWADLPEQVPGHFGLTGEVDRWTDRWMIWTLPAVSGLLWLGMMVLSRFPHIFNYPWVITEKNAHDLYRTSRSMMFWINAEMTLLFAIIQLMVLRTALGHSDSLTPLFAPVVLVSLFGTMGYFLYKSSKMA